MIDMRSFFTHRAYLCVKSKFQDSFSESNCNDFWFSFKDLQKKISNNKCPICEVELTSHSKKTNTATLDHYRPKNVEKYPFLKCDSENYILMCHLCNSTYKKDNFPLWDESKKATTREDICHEEPLILNPTKHDPLDFFELAFRQTQQGGILELKRKLDISKDSYEYKVCETMIKLFGLGYCHKNIHPDYDIKECRIEILTKHYTIFIEIASAINDKNKKALALIFKDLIRKQELEKYGFYRFISKKQFVIK